MGSHLNFKGFASTTSEANATRPQEIPPLARQSSVYSLTFDEFHNTWGSGLRKDFGSMNMDELLKNIWSVEETQAMTNSVAVVEGSIPSGNLQRQASLTLPRTLSQKTVDEVWRDLIKETSVGIKDGTGGVGSNFPQRQPTLGEMTLEEFLVKAGAVRADTPQTGMATNGFLDELSQMNNNSSNGLALGFPQPNQNNVFFGTRTMENSNSLAASQPPNLGLNVGGTRSVQQLPQQQQQLHQPQTQQQQQLHHPQAQQPQQLHRPHPQAQQHLLFPKPATAAYAAPMNLVNSGQLASQGMRSSIVGIADQSTNSSSVHGGGMGMVGSGTGGIRAATTTPANPISPDVISKSNTSSPSPSPVPYVFTRGRKPSAALEKVVERRQRRMIKNRESAARSRARKQAYTLELEAEIAKLKELNDELQKKQAEMVNMKKNEFLEAMNGKWGGKRLCLRRTLTGPW